MGEEVRADQWDHIVFEKRLCRRGLGCKIAPEDLLYLTHHKRRRKGRVIKVSVREYFSSFDFKPFIIIC